MYLILKQHRFILNTFSHESEGDLTLELTMWRFGEIKVKYRIFQDTIKELNGNVQAQIFDLPRKMETALFIPV